MSQPTPEMSLSTFLSELAKCTPENGWRQFKTGLTIRVEHEHQVFCPITAVCYRLTNKRVGLSLWSAAADKIGLQRDTARSIMHSADYLEPITTYVRPDLLRALGYEGP